MADDRARRDLLGAVFAQMREPRPGFAEQRDEFVFHMTDWLDDASALLALFRSDNPTTEDAARQIVGFLYHATPISTPLGVCCSMAFPTRLQIGSARRAAK